MDVHRGGWEEVSKNWLTMLNKNPHNIFYTPMDDSYQQFANKYWNIKWNLKKRFMQLESKITKDTILKELKLAD